MPRPKIDQYWRERVRYLIENQDQVRLTDQKIAAMFEEEGRQPGRRKDWPSARSVGRIRKEFEGKGAGRR